MKRGRWLLLASLTTAVWGRPGIAAADPATAEVLFEEGRRLLESGNNEQACEKFAESQAQDPASGTLINLALCNERLGKLASAWAHYRAAATLARRDEMVERAAAAEEKARELEPRLPRLTLRSSQAPAGLQVSWGERVLGAAALGTALPVDPGEHELHVSAPGYRDASLRLAMAEGENRELELPTLDPVEKPAEKSQEKPAVPRTISVGEQLPRQDGEHRGEHQESPTRSLPLAVGGAAVAALGIGSYFGVTALHEYSRADALCSSHHDCSASAMDARQSAQTRAWVANVALGVGAVGAGAAVYLWFSGRQKRTDTALLVGPGHVVIAGHF